jgi:hypothetical protein
MTEEMISLSGSGNVGWTGNHKPLSLAVILPVLSQT